MFLGQSHHLYTTVKGPRNICEYSNHMCQCVSREGREQNNSQLKMDGLELDNSKSTTCAMELDNYAFSALKLDHSTLRTCAHELDIDEVHGS